MYSFLKRGYKVFISLFIVILVILFLLFKVNTFFTYPLSLFDIDNTIETAIKTQNLYLCEELPVEFVFCLDSNARGEDPEMQKSCNSFNRVKYLIRPRARCLNTYLNTFYDVNVCKSFEKFSQSDSDECYDFLAEAALDDSYCTHIASHNLQVSCEAKILLDHSLCYKSIAINSDEPKYPYSVANCLTDVVLRSKNPDPCLTINDENWGGGWKFLRNNCIAHSEYMSGSPEKNQKRKYCSLMVDDPGKYINEYERCLENIFNQYDIRPRGVI